MSRTTERQRREVLRRGIPSPRDRRHARRTLLDHGEGGLADALRTADGFTFGLPDRAAVEHRIGASVGAVTVRTGPGIAALLEAAGAEAATVDGTIYLPSTDVALGTLVHEVVHVLQSRRLDGTGAGVLPEHHPAEVEAEMIATGRAAEVNIDEAVGPNAITLRRSTTGTKAPDRGADEADDARFDRALSDEQRQRESVTRPAEQIAELSPEIDGPAAENDVDVPASTDADLGADGVALSLGDAEELAPVEPDAETAEAAAEALAASAQSPSAVLAAYRDAPSSVKAAMHPIISTHLQAGRTNEQQKAAGEASASPVEVKIDGVIEAPPLPQVSAPKALTATGEDGAPGDLPTIDVVLEPTPERYRANDDIVGKLDWFEQGDPKVVGESLSSVSTTDPDIETDPGPAPAVPRTGAADDSKLESKRATTQHESKGALTGAVRSVVDGPGPEVVVPQSMEERRAITEPGAAPVSEIAASPVAAEFTTLGLSKDIVGQFDADTSSSMSSGVAGAQAELSGAEEQRDVDRDAARSTAEAEREQLADASDSEQRTAVIENRRAIQVERQATVDAQASAVAKLDHEATTELKAKRGVVDTKRRAAETDAKLKFKQAGKDAKGKVETGEREAADKKRQAEKDAKNRSWWQRALSFVKKAFAALTSLIGKVFAKVRSAVKFVLDKVKSVVKGIIDAVVSVISGLIDAFATFLKGLVTGLLGTVFPELAKKLNAGIDRLANKAKGAVRAVGDKLKAGVDAIVDKLQAAIDKVLDVFEGALKAAVAVVGAMLTGDWAAALKQVLEAALKIIGIAPETFYGFIGKVSGTIATIVRNPGKFLGNAVKAIVGGVKLFSAAFATHLKAGVIGWLTGALGGALEIPKTFDLAGVFSLARQILGLTWDWLRKKAVMLVGEKNVARIEFLWGYVETLMTGGWSALFDQVKEQLTGIKEAIFDGIREMLITKVVLAAITWIASLFNPVGALVKIVMLIWNLYTFVRDQLARVWAMVQAVVSSVSDIATGNLGPAMKKVESVLANLLPIAIDLLARLLGLGSFAGKVRKILNKIRKRIDTAANKLLRKVLQRFRGKGGAKEGSADPKNSKQIGRPFPLTAPGADSHTLQIDVSGRDATVAIHSKPQSVAKWLKKFEDTTLTKLRAAKTPVERKKKDAAVSAFKQATAALRELDPDADAIAAAKATGPKKKGKAAKKVPTDKEVIREQGRLATALKALMSIPGVSADDAVFDAILADPKQTHPNALTFVKPSLMGILKDPKSAAPVRTGGWPAAKLAVLASTHEFFTKPLLRQRKYGDVVQSALSDEIPKIAGRKDGSPVVDAAEKLDSSEKRDLVITHHVAKPIDDNKGGDPRKIVDGHIFGAPTTPGLVKKLTPAIEAGILANAKTSKAGDPAIVAAVKGAGGLVKFLRLMAGNTPVKVPGGHRTIDPTNWDKEYEANSDYFSGAFRGIDKGKHEWIPTSLLKSVVQRVKDSGDAEGAFTWIDVQHELRTPTTGLIFTPDRGVRTSPHPLGGAKEWTVLQGHSHASYAPAKGGGFDPVGKGKKQTKGEKAWHDELRENFKSTASMPLEKGAKHVVAEAQKSFDRMIWDGENTALINVKGPAYRQGESTNPMTYEELKAQFKATRVEPVKVLDASKKIADQLKANKS